MDLLFKRIEVLANAAIIIVAVLLGLVLINYTLIQKDKTHTNQRELTGDKPVPSSGLSPGSKLPLPEIDWSRNDKTLVLALSNNCHFCTESAPFYQRLIKERSNVRTIAVMPQALGESKQYLDRLKIRVRDIKQVSLQSIGVEGTPTLILLDRNGAVLDSWIGKLSNTDELRVLSRTR